MALDKNYRPEWNEPRLRDSWQAAGIYHFNPGSHKPVYSIDTPPPTVSGILHLGHVYSYSQTDFMARYWRMRGRSVFYPMGYDDNGLPTERLIERLRGITPQQVGRQAFIQTCLEVSQEAEVEYQRLWQRIGLSVDWRYSYRTIDDLSRRTSQVSFLDLYHKGLIDRKDAPAIWCPECRTAIAQAELNDLERGSEFVTLAFTMQNGRTLPIATTRPELLSACVAVFFHPEDARLRSLAGQRVEVPLTGRSVPFLTDARADPEKGTGAVMCCTFGDTVDVEWWRAYQLPLIAAIDREGRMTSQAGDLEGLPIQAARREMVEQLEAAGFVLGRQRVQQSVRVHERCDTPVEYIVVPQWFIRVLDFKQELLDAGNQVIWHPENMKARYREWVENLHWDWGISRQRTFGVPFPVWICADCGQVIPAEMDQLPVDPTVQGPPRPCTCGSASAVPDPDVMDTWATSSMSPQIVGRWLADERLYEQVFPFSLRTQAHEIIRTWAFYTIVKSFHEFGVIPWKEIAISGWGLAPEGTGKISKSRGGGPMAPMALIDRYSADAVRYWAASTGFGRDAVISEEKVQNGSRLVTKLWNVARFSERFLAEYSPGSRLPAQSPADRWILARLNEVIRNATGFFTGYDYAAARNEVESFFWNDLADNYLEMAKQRLYGEVDSQDREGALYSLHEALLTVLKLFAPILPFITDEVYRGMFSEKPEDSIHQSAWPEPQLKWQDPVALAVGEVLVQVATAVRRYKSDHNLALATPFAVLEVRCAHADLSRVLAAAAGDLRSVTRAGEVVLVDLLDQDAEKILTGETIEAGVINRTHD